MTKSLFKLHFLGFIVVFIGLLSLVGYQLFVTPQFTRVPITEFIKPKTLKKIWYQAPDIGEPRNFPKPNPLSLNCQPTCNFVLADQIIEAKIDNDPAARLTELKLMFFDPEPGLIGYQLTNSDNPTFFVLNLSGQLLQTVRLNLNQIRLLEFVNYYPKTKEIMFKSTHQETQVIKYWLYQATKPSLRQIEL
jgi:hypothetical protein